VPAAALTRFSHCLIIRRGRPESERRDPWCGLSPRSAVSWSIVERAALVVGRAAARMASRPVTMPWFRSSRVVTRRWLAGETTTDYRTTCANISVTNSTPEPRGRTVSILNREPYTRDKYKTLAVTTLKSSSIIALRELARMPLRTWLLPRQAL
jgi:hypothetical protein